jgi:heptose I phosphotransferase
VRHYHARSDWADFVGHAWPDRIFDVPVTDCFHAKQGRSTGRWILERDGRRLRIYLKRHYRLPWWQGLLATLWPGGAWTPALREHRNLLDAAANGVPVPAVVAAGEWIGPAGRLRSFLAVEELVGMLPLHQAIPRAQARLAPSDFCRWKRGLAQELARLARLLHERRWFHKDLYLCHFYVPEADTYAVPQCWTERVHVIDLHRLKRHAWTWPVWLLKDLGALLFSADTDGVTARDCLRFWHAYCASRGQSWRERWWAWCIRIKAANYRRHQRHTRARTDRGVAAS